MNTLIVPALNLSILLGVLYIYLRKPIQAFVRDRQYSIAEELKKSQGMLREAKIKYEELSVRLNQADQEIASMKAASQKDAVEMRERIILQAHKLSENIKLESNNSAQLLLHELKSDLYKDLSEAVLSRAGKMISDNLSPEDHSRIRQHFARQVEAAR